MESFGEWLDELIRAAGYKPRGFAERVERSHTLIYKVIAGEMTPPPDDLPLWANVLGLRGAESERFIALGRSARAKGKKDSAEYVSDLENAAEMARTVASDLTAFLTALTDFLAHENIHLPRDLAQALKRVESQLRSME